MNVAILWHLHQPLYRDPDRGEYILPWVNFHAVKNYYQMARLVRELNFPCTFNIVPCLLEQLEDYARGTAVDSCQEALEADPASLSDSRLERLAKVFHRPKDAPGLQLEVLRSMFSPLVPADGDRDSLLGLRKSILQNLINDFGQLWRGGLIDITTTPYYHPVLPLIMDQASALEEYQPARPFRYPEDGKAQVENGKAYFQAVFGRAPSGLWPAEGGISQEAAAAVAAAGFSFALTDENILWRSLPPPHRREDLFRSHRAGNLCLFFRDRELSDLIGFEYQRWNEKEAVSHLVAKIHERRCLVAGDESIVTIALDGENPWACYRDNGVPFLRELYSRLKNEAGVRPVLFTEYLSRFQPQRELSLAAGSWLGGFSKWMGSPAKNAYWDLLSQARIDCGGRPEILVAEGSDWFWWAGEPEEPEFDRLFKAWIRKAYSSAGIRPKP